MRFLAVSIVALVLLVTPAAAENPDGPVGLLTVDGAFAQIIAHGEEASGYFAFTPADVGGSELKVDLLAPMTNWLTLGVETMRRARSTEFSARFDTTATTDSWEFYLGVRARVHIPLTAHAKKSLAARDGD